MIYFIVSRTSNRSWNKIVLSFWIAPYNVFAWVVRKVSQHVIIFT